VEISAFMAALRHSLPGQPIRFFRYALNSLIVYLTCTPDDLNDKKGDPGYVVWLEPPWHICSLEAVIVGSREAQPDPDKGDPDWDRLIGLLNPLLGNRVEAVTTDFRSNDLIVIVEGGYLIRTFTSDAQDDHLWHIDDNARQLALYADTQGYKLVARKRPTRRRTVGRGRT
jgi:hypothetical protein